MKYMIMMFGGLGVTLQDRTPEWITGMHELMMKLDTELKEAGEVVASHGLVDPSQAKTGSSSGCVTAGTRYATRMSPGSARTCTPTSTCTATARSYH